MNKILVITDGGSDLLSLLRKHCQVTVISTEQTVFDYKLYDAACVLMGNEEKRINLSAGLHVCISKMAEEGKPVFCEFLCSILGTRLRTVTDLSRQRLVYLDKYFDSDVLCDGDLFCPQGNECIKFAPLEKGSKPILTYKESICAHKNYPMEESEHRENIPALFWLRDNLLISAIRLCNFHRARFSPAKKWQGLIEGIISFLAGEKVKVDFLPPVIEYRKTDIKTAEDILPTVRRGIGWIYSSGLLKRGGAGGVLEGFSNYISARDGEHKLVENVRADCTGEIGGALLFASRLMNDEAIKETADKLIEFLFAYLQVKEGRHKGMLRWSEAAFETCFQDDAARAIIFLLLMQHIDTEVPHLEDIIDALDYMVETTAEDGIRVACTEIGFLDDQGIGDLKKAGSNPPSAHFNAYYHAALLLAYKLCKKEKYLTLAERGLEKIMSCYPNTRRETSETEECCRLIFPLAVLYGVTGKKSHYDMLKRVTEDLGHYRHESGGYAEWDTGYTAFCSRNHKGECALLASNGDPVADLLYSNNWLPLGFAYAYMVTGEEYYRERWLSIASFIASSQMYSSTVELDGAWARGFDMETAENYGMPHDTGWGPCCIESGWTVGEILAGLQFMLLVEEKARKASANTLCDE